MERYTIDHTVWFSDLNRQAQDKWMKLFDATPSYRPKWSCDGPIVVLKFLPGSRDRLPKCIEREYPRKFKKYKRVHLYLRDLNWEARESLVRHFTFPRGCMDEFAGGYIAYLNLDAERYEYLITNPDDEMWISNKEKLAFRRSQRLEAERRRREEEEHKEYMRKYCVGWRPVWHDPRTGQPIEWEPIFMSGGSCGGDPSDVDYRGCYGCDD